jgi:L-threonylcarbamoyladenylate synthase
MNDPLPLSAAVEWLQHGGVIAYPTEAVWGVGCDPFDETAVRRLLAIKERPVEKGLILIAADLEQLRAAWIWTRCRPIGWPRCWPVGRVRTPG